MRMFCGLFVGFEKRLTSFCSFLAFCVFGCHTSGHIMSSTFAAVEPMS